ncbi:MAG TPA: hypothetical protein VFO16_23120 [Pseudonocardiaceae bacterium]|nr:hypothetical protein [Pseudonocardiaceae bacterium]
MNATDLHFPPDLGVRPGESDPAAMLSCVLSLLSVIMLTAALSLAWWLG